MRHLKSQDVQIAPYSLAAQKLIRLEVKILTEHLISVVVTVIVFLFEGKYD